MFNKRMLMSLLTLGILAVVASAGTWAYFDGTQAVNGNNIKAGTLTLYVSSNKNNLDSTSTAMPITAINVHPGEANVKLANSLIYIKNGGTINGVLSMKIVPSSGSEDLSKYLVITADIRNGNNGRVDRTVTLWEKGVSSEQSLGNLDVNAIKSFDFKYSFPSGINVQQSDAQGDTFAFDVVFYLRQR